MNAEKVQRMIVALDNLTPAQSVKIAFNEKTGITGFMRFVGLLKNSSNIRLAGDGAEILLCAVCDSGWGCSAVANRTFTVQGFRNASDGMLLGILKDVDSVEVVDNKVRQLLSGRKKMREDFAEKLIVDILTVEFLNEMEEWQVFVEAILDEASNGISQMLFQLTYENKIFHELTIDGFTGLLSINRSSFDSPEQVRHVLRVATEVYMESVT